MGERSKIIFWKTNIKMQKVPTQAGG